MSRESTFPMGNSRASTLPGHHALDLNNLPPSYQTLLMKQQEYAALQALKETSGDMLKRVEKLAEMSNIMADGGEALGQVLKNWPHVFSTLNLVDKPQPNQSTDESVQEEEQEPIPTLVRLPYTTEPDGKAQ